MSPDSKNHQKFFQSILASHLTVALICVALVFYSWPLVRGPFLMDEVYGVISIWGTDVRDPFFSVVMNPFSDEMLDYFLTKQGRVAPFGVLIYHTGYWLTSSIAFATGVSIANVYSIFKILFLCLSFFGLRQLLIEFSENDGVKDAKKRFYATNLTLLSAFIFTSGLRTDFADRNGLMVYPFLTYTALLYAIWLPIILIRIRRSTYGHIVFPIASVLFGCFIGFGYELHYGAIVTTTIALILTRKNVKILSLARLWDFVLISSFSITFVFNQVLIKSACANADCYTGTSIQIGRELPGTVFYNFVGNLPMKAQSTLQLYSKAGLNFGEPQSISLHTVLPSLIVAILFLSLVFSRSLFRRVNLGSDEVHYRRIPFKGFLTFSALGAFTIAATSLTQLSQEIFVNPVPFRGYVVAWFSISVSATLLIFSASRRLNLSNFISIALGFLLGCYLHAWSIFGVEVVAALPKNASFHKVIRDFQTEPGIKNDNTVRCGDLAALGDTRRAKAVRMNIDGVYSYLYGEKFCSTNLVVLDPVDPFISR